MPGERGPTHPLRGCVVSVGVCASPRVVGRGARGVCALVGCRCRGGVCGRFCRSQWVCFLCLVSSFFNVAPSGLLCEGGRSPFVCASPGRTRTLAAVGARVSPSLGGGSAGLSAGGHAPVCPLPAPLCPRWFFPATAWRPGGVGAPVCVTAFLRGCAFSARVAAPPVVVTPACSIARPGVRPRVSPRASRAWVLSGA